MTKNIKESKFIEDNYFHYNRTFSSIESFSRFHFEFPAKSELPLSKYELLYNYVISFGSSKSLPFGKKKKKKRWHALHALEGKHSVGLHWQQQDSRSDVSDRAWEG